MRFLDWVRMNNNTDISPRKHHSLIDAGATPERRFPEFQGAAGWAERRLDSCLDYQQPTPYLVSDTNYSDIHKTPVLTAGKTFILGYTSELHGIFDQGLPVIIFDDFTTATQFVDFPFKAKSSAMKILQAINGANIKFLYEAMQMISYEVGVHERHWISKFASMSILVPNPDEQKKIADCLSSIDELISAETKKLDTFNTHKKGLMQSLFPADGETVPKLRFQEFTDTNDWVETELGEMGELVSGLTYSPDDVTDTGLLVLRSSNVQNGEICLDDNVYVTPSIKGANLSKVNDILICVRNGSKSLIGKNAILPQGLPLCTHGAFMTVFRSKSAKFVFQLFQTNAYQKQVDGDLGATINSINGSQLKKYKFTVPPTSDEQIKIADCLASLDALVSTQTRKLDVLKAQKLGLMQQLFPSLNEVHG